MDDSMSQSDQSSDPMLGGSEAATINTKRKQRDKDDRICKVCGDKALGFNFNAMTCESCKAFFRRNAIKDNGQPCLFQGNCVVDRRTRRFCSHCRLQKCFDAGMKREMILDDSERKARMQKVLENRIKKQKVDDSVSVVKSESPDMLPDQSDASMHTSAQDSHDDFVMKTPLLWSLTNDLQDSSNVKASKFTPIYHQDIESRDPSTHRVLTLQEYVLFQELGEAYSTSLGALLQDRKHEDDSNYKDCNDLINNSAVTVLRLISFIKQLEDFKLLSTDEKIAALKASVLSSILLRSACFYNPETDSWMTGSGEINTSILLKSTGYKDLHLLHTNFCRSVKGLISENRTLFGLIQVLCIFNPACDEHMDRKKISDIQDKYIVLLKHYLEWHSSYIVSRKLFPNVIKILTELKEVSDAHNAIILQANLQDIEPLMLEVLDLK